MFGTGLFFNPIIPCGTQGTRQATYGCNTRRACTILGATPIPEAFVPRPSSSGSIIPSRSPPHWSRRIRDDDVDLLLYFWNREEACGACPTPISSYCLFEIGLSGAPPRPSSSSPPLRRLRRPPWTLPTGGTTP